MTTQYSDNMNFYILIYIFIIIFNLKVRDEWSEVAPTEDWIKMEDLDGKTYCRYPGT